ncbi:MAG: hypothetical protein CXR30_16510 [Geobacter sp.]|nr:MAG: hypothetical protein CXR30_16510 [Geobacter sp.]
MGVFKVAAIAGIILCSVSAVRNGFADTDIEPNGAQVVNQNDMTRENELVTRRLEGVSKRFNLTTEQQAEVRLILLDEATKMRVIRDDPSQTIAEKKAEIVELREVTENKIRPLLTAEQQIYHDELRRTVLENRKRR